MMIFKNGTTKENLRYKDLCREEEHHVRIAHNKEFSVFRIDKNTNTMFEYPYWKNIIMERGIISHHHVILNTFFKKFNIKPTWIYCNKDWGVFDHETGRWTGAVGQVEILTKN